MTSDERMVAVPRLVIPSGDSRRVRKLISAVGWTAIGTQLIGLLLWSTHVAGRGSMSWDFAAYYQPWWAIAHGHLNPVTTVMPGEYPFWHNDGEFIVWLLSPLYWLFPNHELGLWWIQDVALAGISAVCYRWIGELLPWDETRSASQNLIPAVGWTLTALLLVLNPWIYWSATFAVQMEPFGVLFAMLALRALTGGRRSVWVWCLLGALCGSASLVYVASVGLVGLANGVRRIRQERRQDSTATSPPATSGTLRAPVVIIVASAVWLVALGALHATQSFSNPAISVHRDLAYLNGAHGRGSLLVTVAHAVSHPGAVISVVASHALNLWADTSPAGFVGLLSPVGFLMSAPTLLENSILKGQDFSYPGFASLVAYVALAVGTALVVSRLIRRQRTIGLGLAALALINAIVWCAVWLPKTGSEYVSIDAGAARALSRTAAEIPVGAEVIASQGFVGKFAGRHDIQVFGSPSSHLTGPEVFPVGARSIWFVLSADQGIEVPSTSETDQAIGSIAALPGAKLVSRSDGLWVFSWRPAQSTRSVALGSSSAPVPAWTTSGAAGLPRLSGVSLRWSAKSIGTSGYVVSGDIWRLSTGSYTAHVTMSSTVPANVEIWDDASSGDTLLARQQVRSDQTRTAVITFSVGQPERAPSSTGPAPFDYEPEPPPDASAVEIRVWTPGKGSTVVDRLEVRRGAE